MDCHKRARLLFGADALFASLGMLQDTPQDRTIASDYVRFLLGMAREDPRQHSPKELRSTITLLGAVRRQLATDMQIAAMPGGCGPSSGMAVLAWLGVPSQQQDLQRWLEKELNTLNGTLGIASRVYTETECTPEALAACSALGAPEVHAVVRRSMCMNALVVFSDHVLAAAVANAASLTASSIAEESDVMRAARGRADAFACQRLYASLAGLIGMMMMGAAERAGRELGCRDKWTQTQGGVRTLEIRRRVERVLDAYDRSKRRASDLTGDTYTAQTPGYVAVLQELMGGIVMQARDCEATMAAIVDGMCLAPLYRVTGAQDKKLTFWQAALAVHERRMVYSDARVNVPYVSSAESSAAIVAAATVFSDNEPTGWFVSVLTTFGKAARSVFEGYWPDRQRFYGSNYRDTERKQAAKMKQAGRSDHEIGEAMGFREPWARYLIGIRPRPPSAHCSRSTEAVARLVAAIAVHTRAAMYSDDAAALPAPMGGGVHVAHAAALEVHPTLLAEVGDSVGHLVEHPPHGWYVVADGRVKKEPLEWRTEIAKTSSDRIIYAFRAWSGGAVMTDLFADFFSEVWKRFNDVLCAEGSPWRETMDEWKAEAMRPSEAPPRSKKLMHPYRVMQMQQGIANTLLNERFGPAVQEAETSPAARASLKLHHALIKEVVNRMAYAPYAGHMTRRFCPTESGAQKRKRVSEACDTEG